MCGPPPVGKDLLTTPYRVKVLGGLMNEGDCAVSDGKEEPQSSIISINDSLSLVATGTSTRLVSSVSVIGRYATETTASMRLQSSASSEEQI